MINIISIGFIIVIKYKDRFFGLKLSKTKLSVRNGFKV